MFDDIAALERHIAANPASPVFARLASLYIDGNRPAQALKLCLQGIKLHPDYPTGLLMIARAQIMLRQYSDARQTLQNLLRILPSCTAALRLSERMTELELEYPPYATAGGAYVARQDVTRGGDVDRRQQWSHQDDILPGIEAFAPKTTKATGPDEATEVQKPAQGFDIGDLARRLEGARIPSLPQEDDYSEIAETAPAVEAVNLGSRPVTETLIGIYEQQGRLREAIDGYARLAQLHPDRYGYYEAKIHELEAKARELETRTNNEQSP
jgi:tetratricopeptide (TPR) repeat protein